MTTIAEARDRIFTHFGVFWDAEVISRSILTTPPHVVYQNTSFDPEADVKNWPRSYAAIDVQHVAGGIASLGGSSRLFRREGFVAIEINTLKGDKDVLGGTVLNDLLAQVAMDAFDGVHLTGNIWFQDVFPIEGGPDDGGQFFQTTVTAEFQYDEIK